MHTYVMQKYGLGKLGKEIALHSLRALCNNSQIVLKKVCKVWMNRTANRWIAQGAHLLDCSQECMQSVDEG